MYSPQRNGRRTKNGPEGLHHGWHWRRRKKSGRTYPFGLKCPWVQFKRKERTHGPPIGHAPKLGSRKLRMRRAWGNHPRETEDTHPRTLGYPSSGRSGAEWGWLVGQVGLFLHVGLDAWFVTLRFFRMRSCRVIGERPCAYLAQGGCITQVAFRISINYERPCASNIVYGVKVIPRRNVHVYIYMHISEWGITLTRYVIPGCTEEGAWVLTKVVSKSKTHIIDQSSISPYLHIVLLFLSDQHFKKQHS